MKIVSRLSEEEQELQRLREIIDAATGGAISESGELELGCDLHTLVTQVDITCASLLELVQRLTDENAQLLADIDDMNQRLTNQEIQIESLNEAISEGVEFDDALDHATVDFMESIIASGAAEPTFDGEISFAQNVPLKKEDLKPMIAQAIESWLQSKIR